MADDLPRINVMGSEAGFSLMTQTLDNVANMRIFPVPTYARTDAPDTLPPRDALGASASGIGSIADADA